MAIPLRASLAYPLRGPGSARKLFIGAAVGVFLELVFLGFAYLVSEEPAFSIAPLAVFLNLPVVGYAMRVYRAELTSTSEPLPEWGHWRTLVLHGLLTIVIALVYCIIPIFLLILGLGLLVKGSVLLFLGMVLMVIGILTGIFGLFFLPMGLAHYVVRQRIEAAFHPIIVWDSINRVFAEYITAYMVTLASYILAGLVTALPYVGAIGWPALGFYLLLVQAQLFGKVCARAV